MIAPGQWRRVGRLDEAEARELLSAIAISDPVFGTNDRSISVAQAQAGGVTSSLAVIRPQALTWVKEIQFGKSKLRARFQHAGSWHDLGVTDLAWRAEFADDDLGRYDHPAEDEAFLVISLAEPFHDEHYKLVAGVISLGN
jgi:hypothetical protein